MVVRGIVNMDNNSEFIKSLTNANKILFPVKKALENQSRTSKQAHKFDVLQIGDRGMRQSYRIDLHSLRAVARKSSIISLITKHMSDKILPFLNYTSDDNTPGFRFLDDNGKIVEPEKELIRWLHQTGNKPKIDNLTTYVKKLIRERYEIDNMAIELLYTLDGDLADFTMIDGATIRRSDPMAPYDGDPTIKFLQEYRGVVHAKFATQFNQKLVLERGDRGIGYLLHDFDNPRTDIEFYDEGYSLTEMAIQFVLTLIHSFSFNAGAFTEDRLPRGILTLDGDMTAENVQVMEDYIVGIMDGPANKWRIPIIPSGGEKQKLNWVSLQPSNQDMQFVEWTHFMWSTVSAFFGIDLEEFGIRFSINTTTLGDKRDRIIEHSASRGLRTTINFISDHLNKLICQKKKYSHLRIQFTGLDQEDSAQNNADTTAKLSTTHSLNDILEERGEKKSKDPWADVKGFHNQNIYQAWQSSQQQDNDYDYNTIEKSYRF